MNTKALINTVESFLAQFPPSPWKMTEQIIVDAQGKEMSETDKNMFLQDACEMMEDLIKALKEADQNLMNALMREQKTLEEVEESRE